MSDPVEDGAPPAAAADATEAQVEALTYDLNALMLKEE